jgi:hypothetical protein
MNGHIRAKKYVFLAKRDGEYCRGCHALPSERKLIVDHVDNNYKNNKDENLQLLCRACNYLKNPRRPLDLCERGGEIEDQSELGVSKLKQPAFRKYVFQLLNEQPKIPEKDLINSACEVVDISPVTGKRYLDKMCSSEGTLRRSITVKTVVVSFKDELKLS